MILLSDPGLNHSLVIILIDLFHHIFLILPIELFLTFPIDNILDDGQFEQLKQISLFQLILLVGGNIFEEGDDGGLVLEEIFEDVVFGH